MRGSIPLRGTKDLIPQKGFICFTKELEKEKSFVQIQSFFHVVDIEWLVFHRNHFFFSALAFSSTSFFLLIHEGTGAGNNTPESFMYPALFKKAALSCFNLFILPWSASFFSLFSSISFVSASIPESITRNSSLYLFSFLYRIIKRVNGKGSGFPDAI